MTNYELEVGLLLMRMKSHFADINEGKDLTEADKKQLKDFYLQNFIAPKARKMLEQHIAEEEARNRRTVRHPDRH